MKRLLAILLALSLALSLLGFSATAANAKDNFAQTKGSFAPEYFRTDADGMPESPHDYPYDMDKYWYILRDGVESITVTFSEDTYTESGYDFIYIYDERNQEIGCYTDNQLAGQTVTVPGDMFQIRLVSNSTYNAYGFRVTNISTGNVVDRPDGDDGFATYTVNAVQIDATTVNVEVSIPAGVCSGTIQLYTSEDLNPNGIYSTDLVGDCLVNYRGTDYAVSFAGASDDGFPEGSVILRTTYRLHEGCELDASDFYALIWDLTMTDGSVYHQTDGDINIIINGEASAPEINESEESPEEDIPAEITYTANIYYDAYGYALIEVTIPAGIGNGILELRTTNVLVPTGEYSSDLEGDPLSHYAVNFTGTYFIISFSSDETIEEGTVVLRANYRIADGCTVSTDDVFSDRWNLGDGLAHIATQDDGDITKTLNEVIADEAPEEDIPAEITFHAHITIVNYSFATVEVIVPAGIGSGYIELKTTDKLIPTGEYSTDLSDDPHSYYTTRFTGESYIISFASSSFIDEGTVVLRAEYEVSDTDLTADDVFSDDWYLSDGLEYLANQDDGDIEKTMEVILYEYEVFTVTFTDWDGSVIHTTEVRRGESAIAPFEPVREGYRFIGWSTSLDNITEDTTAVALYEADYILGDVNLDGVVNSLDAAQILKHDAFLITLVDGGLLAADVNGDTIINSLDAALVLKFDASLITEFPAGQPEQPPVVEPPVVEPPVVEPPVVEPPVVEPPVEEPSAGSPVAVPAGKTNYAAGANYVITKNSRPFDINEPNVFFRPDAEGSDSYELWGDIDFTKLTNGRTAAGEDMNANGELAGVTVTFVGDYANFDIIIDLGEVKSDIGSIVFCGVRDSKMNNDRGFNSLATQIWTSNTADTIDDDWGDENYTAFFSDELDGAPVITSSSNNAQYIENFNYTFELRTPASGRYVRIRTFSPVTYLQFDEIMVLN